MKYCHRPFDFLYLDHFDGEVYLCPWMDPQKSSIGNILQDKLDDIWFGERAEEIRDTIRNGSYCLCRKVACPHLQNDDLPNLNLDRDDGKLKANEAPGYINLAFDFVCNQSCPTCRNSVFVPDEKYDNNLNEIVKRIQPYVNRAKIITASGHGDPFASPYMMKILENLKPEHEDIQILLETNAVFFDEAHWKRIEHLSKYTLDIVITTNSFYEPIYNQISRGGNLNKLLDNLVFIKKLREDGLLTKITNGIVVQEKNYWEIPEFIERSLNEYGFDNVVLKPVYNWGNLTEEEYWFKDVLNPYHPYHEEYKRIINLPIVKDNPRVYNFGGEMMHEPKPMPGSGNADSIKNDGYTRLFKKWLGIDDIEECLISYLQKEGTSSYMIYGAGDIGRRLAKELKGHYDVKLLGFIDYFVRECKVDDIPVYKPECCEIFDADLIIVTPVHIFEDISAMLKEKGYEGKIVSIEHIIDAYCTKTDCC